MFHSSTNLRVQRQRQATRYLFRCFTQLCLCLHFWQLLRYFIVLGHFDSIIEGFSVSWLQGFTCFVFCFMNKYDSRSLKYLFISTSRIASIRVCWGVYNYIEYDKFASALLCFICALSHVLWALRLKSIKLLTLITTSKGFVAVECSKILQAT